MELEIASGVQPFIDHSISCSHTPSAQRLHLQCGAESSAHTSLRIMYPHVPYWVPTVFLLVQTHWKDPGSLPLPMADHPLDAALTALMDERPRISDAMKNLVSVIAAGDATGAGPRYEMGHLLAIAKTVLKATNELALPSPSEWAEAHPQGVDEGGVSRISTLTNYKACHTLVTEIQAKAGAKVTKMLGRGLLRHTRCWEDALRTSCASELAALRYPPATVEAVLDAWARSFSSEVAEDDDLLVWAADFPQALQSRQRARQQEVVERRERIETGQNEADALRAALAAEGTDPEAEHQGEEEPRLVEVPA